MEKKRKKESKKQGRKKEFTGNSANALCLGKGMAMAFAITAIVFIAYGILLTYTGISEARIPLISLLCTAVSTMVAGFDWAKCQGKRGLLWGLLAGLIYVILLFLIVTLAGGGFVMGTTKLTMALVAIAGGGVGGILGMSRVKPVRKTVK